MWCAVIMTSIAPSEKLHACSEELTQEIEALLWQYPDLLLTIDSRQRVHIDVMPEVSTAGAQAFVQLTLQLAFPQDYPANAPPSISFTSSKGLSSKKLARILEHVQSEADHLLGDLMLGQLYEAAKEQLTELNSPEGGCIICLEEFADTMTLEQQPSQLPCYHCFHRSCLQGWWHWEQSHRKQRRQQVLKERGAAAIGELQRLELVPDVLGTFPLGCPVCRMAFSSESFLTSARGQSSSGYAFESDDSTVNLAPDQMQALRLMQQQHAAQLSRQRRVGGLVDQQGYAVSLESLAIHHPRRRHPPAHDTTVTAIPTAHDIRPARSRPHAEGKQSPAQLRSDFGMQPGSNAQQHRPTQAHQTLLHQQQDSGESAAGHAQDRRQVHGRHRQRGHQPSEHSKQGSRARDSQGQGQLQGDVHSPATLQAGQGSGSGPARTP